MLHFDLVEEPVDIDSCSNTLGLKMNVEDVQFLLENRKEHPIHDRSGVGYVAIRWGLRQQVGLLAGQEPLLQTF